MKILGIICFLLFGLFSCGPSKSISDSGWRFIADKWVNFSLDRDVIQFGDIKDDFRYLKLRVTDAPLRMYNMKVYFDNGEVQDVPIKSLLRQGAESRIIELRGGLRHLNKIEFWYETKGRAKGHARIAVWGSK